jgi:hypothetical protein
MVTITCTSCGGCSPHAVTRSFTGSRLYRRESLGIPLTGVRILKRYDRRRFDLIMPNGNGWSILYGVSVQVFGR